MMTKNDERRLTPGRRAEDVTSDSLLQHLADKFQSFEEERRERLRRITDRSHGLRRLRNSPDTTDEHL